MAISERFTPFYGQSCVHSLFALVIQWLVVAQWPVCAVTFCRGCHLRSDSLNKNTDKYVHIVLRLFWVEGLFMEPMCCYPESYGVDNSVQDFLSF